MVFNMKTVNFAWKSFSGGLNLRLCDCGCGNPSPISPVNHARLGYVKGQPRKYIRGHAMRGKHHTLETKNNIRKNATTSFKKGHVLSEESISKIRRARVAQRFPLHRSSIEVALAALLSTLKIDFEQNIPLEGVCIPDMFIKPNIVIFCDGDYWHNLPNYKTRDERINKILRAKGYKVLRFWEHEIKTEIEKCGEAILCQI